MGDFHKTFLADFTPQEVTPLMYKLLGLQEAPWDDLMAAGMDPDTYVYGQCADAVRGVGGKVPVYMGIGVDAPGVHPDQARLYARYRLPQCPCHLPCGWQGCHLCAQLRQHVAGQSRRRRPCAHRTGIAVMSQVRIYLADPMIRTEQMAAIRRQLPAEWL